MPNLSKEEREDIEEIVRMLLSDAQEERETSSKYSNVTEQDINDAKKALREVMATGFGNKKQDEVLKEKITKLKEVSENTKRLDEKQHLIKKLRDAISSKDIKEKINEHCETITQGVLATLNMGRLMGKMAIYKAQKNANDYMSAREGKASIEEEYKNSIIEVYTEDKEAQKVNQEELEKLQQLEQLHIAILNADIADRDIIKRREDSRRSVLVQEFLDATDEHDREKQKVKLAELISGNKSSEIAKYDKLIDEDSKKLNQIRYDMDECEKRIALREEYTKQLYLSIESIKNSKMSGLVKQNFWQKATGFIFSRFGGAKKMAKNAIEEVQDKINVLKTEILPEMKKQVAKLKEGRATREARYDEEYGKDYQKDEEISKMTEKILELENEIQRMKDSYEVKEPKKGEQVIE